MHIYRIYTIYIYRWLSQINIRHEHHIWLLDIISNHELGSSKNDFQGFFLNVDGQPLSHDIVQGQTRQDRHWLSCCLSLFGWTSTLAIRKKWIYMGFLWVTVGSYFFLVRLYSQLLVRYGLLQPGRLRRSPRQRQVGVLISKQLWHGRSPSGAGGGPERSPERDLHGLGVSWDFLMFFLDPNHLRTPEMFLDTFERSEKGWVWRNTECSASSFGSSAVSFTQLHHFLFQKSEVKLWAVSIHGHCRGSAPTAVFAAPKPQPKPISPVLGVALSS